MKLAIATVFVCLFVVGSVQSFAPVLPTIRCNTALTTTSNNNKDQVNEVFRQFTATLIVAGTIASNVVMAAPQQVMAWDNSSNDVSLGGSSSTLVIAARSGGRAGGRSASPARRAPTRVIERQTTIIQQQPSYSSAPSAVFMAPPPVYYAPQPSGLGLAIGLNAVSGISEGFREARQENEIRSTRDQLTEARIKEAEMEARLRGLEQQQVMAR